jgi:glycosyltransferase involved in cell wall biosynthesis
MTEPARQQTLLICTPSHVLQGGVERIIERLATGLPAHGFRVILGLARGSRFHLPERYRQEYPALDCVEVDGRSGTRLGRVHGLHRAIEQTRPDVVLIARLFDAFEAVVERKHRGEPLRLAVTLQAYEPDYIADLAAYADWVDLCVTAGKMIARAVGHFTTVRPDRVASIPAGVRPVRRSVEHDDARPLRLGYVGRLEQAQKRILDLPETLERLRAAGVPFTCRVVGAGPEEAELRGRLAARGFDPQEIVLGWRDTDGLYSAVYPDLDVLLHFAAWEGVPHAPREAMAHGVVPVASRFIGCLAENELIDGDNALLFDVGNLDGAVACVARLHGDRALLRRLSRAAVRTQWGINTEEGAVAAWAQGFRRALALPPRTGASPPRLAFAPAGRLERWGLPPAWSEAVRRWLGRQSPHLSPGSEWPHTSGLADRARLKEIEDYATVYEGELRAGTRTHAEPEETARH